MDILFHSPGSQENMWYNYANSFTQTYHKTDKNIEKSYASILHIKVLKKSLSNIINGTYGSCNVSCCKDKSLWNWNSNSGLP